MRILKAILGVLCIAIIADISGLSCGLLVPFMAVAGLLPKQKGVLYFTLLELLSVLKINQITPPTALKYRVTITKLASTQGKFVVEAFPLGIATSAPTLDQNLIETNVQTQTFDTTADMAIVATAPNGQNVKISYLTVEIFKA